MSVGNVPCSSSFCATGMMRSRVNFRAVSTSRCCSSLREKSMGPKPTSLSDEPGGSLFQEGAHPLGPVLRVEEQREGLRLLAVRRAERNVVAALDQALRTRHGERAAGGDLLRHAAAMSHQLSAR